MVQTTFLLCVAESLEHNRAFGVIQRAHLVFPVQELFCRSVWCGKVQNRAQDRGWALLNTSYSNTKCALLLSCLSAQSPSFQSAPPLSSPQPFHYVPLLFSFLAPPSSASSCPPLLPAPSSSCVVSRPCSQSPSPSCPGNVVLLGVPARHYTAEYLPEVSVTALEMWMRQWMLARGYLAELVQLLKQLVVNIK